MRGSTSSPGGAHELLLLDLLVSKVVREGAGGDERHIHCSAMSADCIGAKGRVNSVLAPIDVSYCSPSSPSSPPSSSGASSPSALLTSSRKKLPKSFAMSGHASAAAPDCHMTTGASRFSPARERSSA